MTSMPNHPIWHELNANSSYFAGPQCQIVLFGMNSMPNHPIWQVPSRAGAHLGSGAQQDADAAAFMFF